MILEAIEISPTLILYVWYAWLLCREDLVLQAQAEPVLDTTMIVPNFTMVYACPEKMKKAP